MLLRDKTGGGLLQAVLEPPLGAGQAVLVADNGRKSIELDPAHAAEFYRLVSATKQEVAELKKAGYALECVDDFEARDG